MLAASYCPLVPGQAAGRDHTAPGLAAATLSSCLLAPGRFQASLLSQPKMPLLSSKPQPDHSLSESLFLHFLFPASFAWALGNLFWCWNPETLILGTVFFSAPFAVSAGTLSFFTTPP